MAVTPTYVALASVTLASTDSSVTFSSIPATYRDLIVVMTGTSTALATVGVRLNGDTGSNYSYVLADGNGSAATSASGTLSFAVSGIFFTSQSVCTIQIMDYSATDKHTTILSRGDAAGDRARMSAARWANTAAVTSVTIQNATYNSGTTLSLYGLH